MTTTTQYPYQVMPDLTREEYEALKADIAVHGILIPVEHDEHKNTLDGHHRERAWHELQAEGVIDKDAQYPITMRVGLTEEQKLNHARAVNLLRRHLTPEQRKPIWIVMRRTGMSYRQIGEASGVAHTTVMDALQESTGVNTPVDLPATVVGKDGKERAATKPKTQPEAPKTVVTTSGKKEEKLDEAIGKKGVENVPEGLSFDNQINKKAHVAQNSGESEWYTPQKYIDAAVAVLGSIDVDPASTEIANKTVKAKIFYSAEDDGLQHQWIGNVWMNPPYSQPAIQDFANKCIEQYNNKNLANAIILVNNATETEWFQSILEISNAVCFVKGRIKFLDPKGNPGAPLQGQAILYIGKDKLEFAEKFSEFGIILYGK